MTRVRWRNPWAADRDSLMKDRYALEEDYRKTMQDYSGVVHDYTSLRMMQSSKASFLQLLMRIGCMRVRDPRPERPGFMGRFVLLMRAWLGLSIPPVSHRWGTADWELVFKTEELKKERYPTWSRKTIDDAVSFCPGCGVVMHRSKAGLVPQNCSDMDEYFRVREVMDS